MICVRVPHTYLKVIDTFVQYDVYASRSQFVRTAILERLKEEIEVVKILSDVSRQDDESPSNIKDV